MNAEDAAQLVRPVDTLGMGLGPCHPAAFLDALGRRTDWEDLRINGAFLGAFTDLFSHPNVHFLSLFFGPLERLLKGTGANIGFAPADYRRFSPIIERAAPRVMTTIATPPDGEGRCSLSLHAGHTIRELHRAAADPDRLLIVEIDDAYPRTFGMPPEHPHSLALDEIDVVVESSVPPLPLPEAPPREEETAIAEHISGLIADGSTLQTGFGPIPSAVVSLLAQGDGGDYGIHTEMFTTGLMDLHESGKVSNRKGQFDGVSVTTFAGGSTELYEWLDGNHDVAFLPVDVVNSPLTIRSNRSMVTINGAIAVDVHGQVVADTLTGRQYSGIGGHEDFVSGPALSLDAQSIICMPSTVMVGGERQSRIMPWFPAGTVITTPRHQVDVIVTEFGVASLHDKTVHQRGEALAAVAHPDFREEILEAAARASGGSSPLPPP